MSPKLLALPALLTMTFAVAAPAWGDADPSDPLFAAAEAEFQRVWGILSAAPEPAHWMALSLVDRATIQVEATHGAASTVRRDAVRLGDLDLRVGTPALDNTHKLRDASWFSDEPRPMLDLPVATSPARALGMSIWHTADESYRIAQRRLIKVRNNEAVKVTREDRSADFSDAPVVVDLQVEPPLAVDGELWQGVVRRASARFLDYPEVFDSNVQLYVEDDERRFMTSEGTRLRFRAQRLRVAAWASTVAEDGMQLEVYDYVEVGSPAGLPDEDAVLAMVVGVAERVTALRHAPLVDPYAGPAILRGRAAAVFFHEILGHRVEGHRQKDEDEGQTLTDKVGQPIFPDFIDVVDDPTLAKWGDVDLTGHYRYDDEGVAAERVSVIRDGVLEGFLQSRSPIEGFARSNGHGRRQPGSEPVARQGNLLVTASRSVPYDALRAQLVAEIKRQDKPFGLIFDDISGGFTFTGRVTPNAFNVRPVTVWRVYPDGRPDELVRGVDLIGTPLTVFSRIIGASDKSDIFNGVCGAESGWVPVSAVAPDLLLSEVEVQRKEKDNDRPPLLPPPALPGGDA